MTWHSITIITILMNLAAFGLYVRYEMAENPEFKLNYVVAVALLSIGGPIVAIAAFVIGLNSFVKYVVCGATR